MNGELLCVSIANRDTIARIRKPVREFVADQSTILGRLAHTAAECFILATCERFELYAVTTQTSLSTWVAPLAEWFDASAELLTLSAGRHRGDAAAERLLRVAAGLESRIVGEPHILGQVRDAFLAASEARTTGAVLNALGRSAIHTGKRVRNEASAGTKIRSIVTIAIENFERTLFPLATRTVLIAGSGRLAAELAGEFAARRTSRLMIASRDQDRALALAHKFQGVGLHLGGLTEALSQSDGVVTCTHSPPVVIDRSTFGELGGRKLRILDLGMPHNVDESVRQVPGVELVDLDGLVLGGVTHIDVQKADRIVAEELARFVCWRRERTVTPIIARMVQRRPASDLPGARAGNRALHHEIMRLKAGVTTA